MGGLLCGIVIQQVIKRTTDDFPAVEDKDDQIVQTNLTSHTQDVKGVKEHLCHPWEKFKITRYTVYFNKNISVH